MSRFASLATAFALLTAEFSHAQYTIGVDILSQGEADYAGLPPDTLCVDIFGFWGNFDLWSAGGVRGVTSNSARLLYAPRDPNNPDMPALFGVGVANRYRTSFSAARLRIGPRRFTNAGAAAAGAWNPPAPTPVATENEINLAYFMSPPETPEGPVSSGYVGRIALDFAAVPGHPTQLEAWHAGLLTDAPADAVFIFRSEPPESSPLPGTVHATIDHPQLYGIDWGVWFVPEPSSLVLILGGICFAQAIRRRLP